MYFGRVSAEYRSRRKKREVERQPGLCGGMSFSLYIYIYFFLQRLLNFFIVWALHNTTLRMYHRRTAERARRFKIFEDFDCGNNINNTTIIWYLMSRQAQTISGPYWSRRPPPAQHFIPSVFNPLFVLTTQPLCIPLSVRISFLCVSTIFRLCVPPFGFLCTPPSVWTPNPLHVQIPHRG